MKIKMFTAIFKNKDAAMHFADIIAEEFCYLIKGNAIYVRSKKVCNSELPLFTIDGEKLSSIANKSGNLERVCY